MPAYTVGMVCGSGMKSVIEGARAIMAGEADVIVAGGGKDAKITEILAGYINNDLHLYRGLNRRRDEKNA